MVEACKVRINVSENPKILYVKVKIESCGHKAWAVIEDDHDRIVETGLDSSVSDFRKGGDGENAPVKCTLDYNLTVKEIYSFSQSAAFEDIRFILADRDLNLALLVCQVFENLKAVFALPADGSEGRGYVKSDHPGARDSDPHAVLENIPADLNVKFIFRECRGCCFQDFRGFGGGQRDGDRFGAT